MLKYSSCTGWHGASYSRWLYDNRFGFTHGGDGVFAFNFEHWTNIDRCGRGVAVIGIGL